MIRLGEISFLNHFPISYGCSHTRLGEPVRMSTYSPARLNLLLSLGQLEISPISLLSYAEHYEDYWLLPNLSISAAYRVKSVALFSRFPIDSLAGQSVALPDTSATSRALLRLLLEEYYGLPLVYSVCKPDLMSMLANHAAALLIGDVGLQAYYEHNRSSDLYVYDLVALWRSWTGLPVVFAVWAVRKDWAVKNKVETRGVARWLQDGKAYSRRHRSEMLAAAVEYLPLPEDYIEEYLDDLSYDLGPEQQEGMDKFLQLLYEHKFVERPVTKEFFSEY